jgi:hypothetical protein
MPDPFVFGQLVHDDPRHKDLAICLIWWIPLLMIPLVSWALSGSWNGMSLRLRWTTAAALLIPIGISAIQLTTSWSLAGHWAPLVADPLAVASYACLVILGWLSIRGQMVRGICVVFFLPVAAIALMSLTDFILLLNMFSIPHSVGRLSPAVTWRTDWTSMSFTSDWVAYSVYSNPKWFPLIKRQIVDDRCFTSEIVDDNPAFRLSPDGKSVIVSCRQDDGKVEDKRIQLF